MKRLMTLFRRARAEDGQALVELAVVLPVFCLLLCGLFSFAMVLFGWCNVTFATRAAARYASLHSSTSLNPATNASITAVITPFLVAATSSGVTTTVSYNSSNTIGSTVKVTVSAQYGVVMPFTSYTSFTVANTDQRSITR